MGQIKIYFKKWMRLFWTTNGWKVFVFAGIIAGVIAAVVDENMCQETVVMNGKTISFIFQTQQGAFAIVSACIWIGIFNSIQEICKERDIIKREHRSGMKISSYIFARALYEMVICAIQALIILIVSLAAFGGNLPESGAVLGVAAIDLYVEYFLILTCSDFLGIAISSIVKTTTTAMTVMPFVLIVQLVMSGVLFQLKGAVGGIANLTISKWGLRMVGASCGMGDMAPKGSVSPDIFTQSQAWSGIGLIILFMALYLAIAIISLSFVDRDKR